MISHMHIVINLFKSFCNVQYVTTLNTPDNIKYNIYHDTTVGFTNNVSSDTLYVRSSGTYIDRLQSEFKSTTHAQLIHERLLQYKYITLDMQNFRVFFTHDYTSKNRHSI